MGGVVASDSASSCGNVGWITEFLRLSRASQVAAKVIGETIAREVASVYDPARATIERLLGRTLQGTQALEVGPGQWLAQARYFGRWARVTGVDLDVLPQGFDVAGYWRMYRSNGARRLMKTLARKAMGFDRRVTREYERALGKFVERPRLMRMDATRTEFGDESFDFTYSFNVLEHVPRPDLVFREGKRLVKHGGVILHDIHLYTSDSGCHDPRIVSLERGELPLWPHLDGEWASKVQYGGYLNKFRLSEWREMIERELPGAEVVMRGDEYAEGTVAAERKGGKLSGYSDEELTTRNIVVAWRKP